MEELRKLEQVQSILKYMESRGVVATSSANTDQNSNRFLANLIIFLIQPCGGLDMNNKCSLLSQLTARLSATFLEEAEASLSLTQPGVINQHDTYTGFQQIVSGTALQLPNDRTTSSFSQYDYKNMAMVGLDSMQQANSTLEDFCRSYFMFHGLDVSRPQSIFKHLPVLAFTESYIYQLDRMNEKLLQTPNNEKSVLGGRHESATGRLDSCFPNDPFRPLVNILEHKGLLTDRIREEFRQGEEYWALERKLCCALVNKEKILVEDVMKAIHLKSFDYRVLNLVLYQLQGEKVELISAVLKVEELHMEFLSVSEFLVEVSDDLLDLIMGQDDVLENNFNILRMFIKIYGASTAPAKLAKCISDAEEKYDKLLKSLDPQLSLRYQQRCEEATTEGGKVCGHPLGTWNIPAIIVEEELYRSKLKSYCSGVASSN